MVVDGSPNSLEELRTKRQRVHAIMPMTKEMVCQIGQLQDLFKFVKDAGLADTAVLGGIPGKRKQKTVQKQKPSLTLT